MTGARDTAAGLLLQPFFIATSVALEGTAQGSERAHEHARMILDEMTRLVPSDTPEWERLFARLYHDKRAFSFLMQGTAGKRPLPGQERWLDEAEAEYLLALRSAANDARGTLKVEGGLALTRYLRHSFQPRDGVAQSKQQFLEKTRWVWSQARATQARDVEGWAAINLKVMERGEFVGWTPYEVV